MIVADGGHGSTIYADDRTDRRRWRCPNNHREWEPTANGEGIHCVACARMHDVDPEFDTILDTDAGEIVNWRDVTLVWDSGTGQRVRLRGEIQSFGSELAINVPERLLGALGMDGGGVKLERKRRSDSQTVFEISSQ